jgi:uncharacterized protein
MNCRYCYSLPEAHKSECVSVEAVRAASRFVAGICAERNVPFTLAIHGGGEPTMESRRVESYLEVARDVARTFGLRPRTYISTNGVISEEAARWLATEFDLIGVSCDGPPDIQDRQRPGRNGQPLSRVVGRTMSTFGEFGRSFHVRTTITRETIGRQAEIVAYLADRYSPTEIRLEPVYDNPSGEPPMNEAHAAEFVSGFLAAEAAGAARGVSVSTSITRFDTFYGPYCNVLRRVVNLIPGDAATACFLDSRPSEVERRGGLTGRFNPARGVFEIDKERTHSLMSRCSAQPTRCQDCLCRYQCTHGCPDRCVLEESRSWPLGKNENGGFRCRVNRELSECLIREAARQLWARTPQGGCREVRNTRSKMRVAVFRNGSREEVPS